MTRLARVLALWFVLWLSPRAAHAQTPPPAAAAAAARDLITLDPARFAAPPLPADHTRVTLGSLTVSHPRAMAPLVADTLSAAPDEAARVAAQFGLATVPPIEVRLVDDEAMLRALAPVNAPPPPNAVGVAYPGLRLILVASREPATLERSDMRRVLRHELAHVLLDEAAGHAAVPRWVSEGVAVELAGEHSLERFQHLAVAGFMGRVLPLRRLDESFGGSPDRVDVAYAESADFVNWLWRSEGRARFRILLEHLAQGMAFEDALRETYGATLTHLESEWRQDLTGRYALAPLWMGTGFLWVLAAAIMVGGSLRRRRKTRDTLARWEREDRRDRLAGTPMVVVHRGPSGVMLMELRAKPAANDDAARDEGRDDAASDSSGEDEARRTLH